MSKEILINSSGYETRIALVENGMLLEVLHERQARESIVGNIYKGRVEKVLPGLQAAFVDIGMHKSAFMHASDVAQHNSTEDVAEHMPKIQNISSLVHEGQDVVVQVYKDQMGSKGARVTTQLSIPSRYLVMMPEEKQMSALSVRITDEDERKRLMQILQGLNEENPGFGLIARTNAEGASKVGLFNDYRFLKKLWEKLSERIHKNPAKSLIYSEFTLDKRTIRDEINEDLTKITIDSLDVYRDVTNFIQDFAADWRGELVNYQGSRPLFDFHNIDDEIDKALSRQVPLKSGGNLVFDQNEAMTTIDVNTGQFVGYKSLEDTAFKTNLEAAYAIARQIRLRNLAGIIIIDFIDMYDPEHKEQLLHSLEERLSEDSSKTHVLGITNLGLVEVTRKRTTDTLHNLLCEPCDRCDATGMVKTIETLTYQLFREISRSVKQFKASKVLVIASVNLVEYIFDEHNESIAEIEETLSKQLSFQAEESYSRDQYDVVLL